MLVVEGDRCSTTHFPKRTQIESARLNEVAEAEEVVRLLDISGILSFSESGIRDETGKGKGKSTDEDGDGDGDDRPTGEGEVEEEATDEVN